MPRRPMREGPINKEFLAKLNRLGEGLDLTQEEGRMDLRILTKEVCYSMFHEVINRYIVEMGGFPKRTRLESTREIARIIISNRTDGLT